MNWFNLYEELLFISLLTLGKEETKQRNHKQTKKPTNPNGIYLTVTGNRIE